MTQKDIHLVSNTAIEPKQRKKVLFESETTNTTTGWEKASANTVSSDGHYRHKLSQIKFLFPQPVSDQVHDSYFVHSVMRALDAVDSLKNNSPILGQRRPLDFEKAHLSQMQVRGLSMEEVTEQMAAYCEGLPLYGHPRTQINVVPQPTMSSLIGGVIASLYNPNLVWDEFSHGMAVAEVEMISQMAHLIGYDVDRAGGLFTFGGTGTTLYGIKMGLEKAVPGAMRTGVREQVSLFASASSHYCRYNVSGWLGLGTDANVTIPVDEDNAMDLQSLRSQLKGALEKGIKVAGIIATLGTTDAFGIDDLQAIVEMRDELVKEMGLSYVPHVHADAVIGWAWSVFNEYSFDENPLKFRPRTIRALAKAKSSIRHLHLADSVGFDFHKSGFAPYASSLVLFKEKASLELLHRPQELMPYLYQTGHHKPGMYSLETSRACTGMLSALANMKLFGKEGFQILLGHIVEMAQLLREYLEANGGVVVLNRNNVGPVTLFRVYPEGVDIFKVKEETDPKEREALLYHNEYNRRVYHYVREQALLGAGAALSLTDCYRHTSYGEPVVALKSFIFSPFVDEKVIEAVSRTLLSARQHLADQEEGSEGDVGTSGVGSCSDTSSMGEMPRVARGVS